MTQVRLTPKDSFMHSAVREAQGKKPTLAETFLWVYEKTGE